MTPTMQKIYDLLVSRTVTKVPGSSKGVMTLARIIDCSFDAAYSAMRGKHFPWASQKLNQATLEGRLTFASLGAKVTHQGETYDTKELKVPVAWSVKEEADNPKENQRIMLAKNLIENGIHAHEDLLEQLVGMNDLVVSKHYHVDKGDIQEYPDKSMRMFYIYTAYVALPKGSLGHAE